MARTFNKEDIERLKKNISILHVCGDHGIELKKNGTRDYIGKCPFHDDEKPSFVVTPSKNLFHCMGCDSGGSVIDLVMKLDGLTFREAVDKLMLSAGLIQRGVPAKQNPALSGDSDVTGKPGIPEERIQQLLNRAVSIYEKNFTENDQGKKYLQYRGLTDAGLFSKHQIGYCTGKLTEILPGNGGIREELRAIGILTGDREHFAGCAVFPVHDVDGNIVTLYGRYTNDGMRRHVYLPGRNTGLWNIQVIKTYPEIILVESIIDALSAEVAGSPNVVSIQSTNGLTEADIALFEEHGVRKLILLLDGDQAGQKAAERLKERCSSFSCEIKRLPDDLDPNSYLQKYGAEKLAQFINSEVPGSAETTIRAGSQSTQGLSESSGNGLVFAYGLRKYRIMGLEKGMRKLRATVKIEHAGKLHVDTLDFYSARARRALAQDLCRIFEETPETIEADITRLLQELETAPEHKPGTQQKPAVEFMTPADRKEAEDFGRREDLIKQILSDYETCGLVGEEQNKLLGYVAMTSRKQEIPLSVLILSCSGAGKTALQDATIAFCPPEEMLKLTSLSGKALFYKDQNSLKHKVLALEEDDGAEEASYAIRNLISARELVSESTIKDLATGRLTTMENRVEGPTSVFLTTTNPEIDPETKSRFFVTSIDESRQQTRAILAFQRQKHTSDTLTDNHDLEAVLKLHRNFQRLLKPVAVKNPFADQLTYGDDRLQGRRDQPKYLNMIKAVAFLRQMQKEIQYENKNGNAVPFVTVDMEDLRIANELANEILGKSLDELSRPSRSLLMLLDEMAEAIEKRLKKENDDHTPKRTSISFSRRDVREFTGWTNTRLHIHLKELVDFEYIIVETGRNGMPYRYRLAYEGQGKTGERFMLGLKDVDEL